MRLKSIKLAGFKSFVDATTVSFPHNMTAIVGPNGCGKSNVIDAVRWVMGESSAKNLRGESMTDVIFNGSTGRQPVGQASIELLFDNTSGKLTGEYAAFNEISIRRKVTREGISQYYLNGSKCRRRDVTDIFLGTGMGPRSYAIIEQGMISRLIESKPEELRVYLEEAAGISKYKERRRDTENRISRTRENLERLADLREELGKQLAHLSRQAKAAEKYKAYKKDERLTAAKLHALNWQVLGEQVDGLIRAIAEQETQVEKSVLARTENESLIERMRLEHEQKQDAFGLIQSKFYALGGEVAKLEQDLKYRREQAALKASTEQKLKRDAQSVNSKIEETERELEVLSAQVLELQPDLEAVREQAETTRCLLDEKELIDREWQVRWDEFDQVFRETLRHKDSLSSKLEQQRIAHRDRQVRRDQLRRECDELQLALDDKDLQAVEISAAEIEEIILKAQENLSSKHEACANLRLEIADVERVKGGLLSEVRESHAVLSSLNELQRQAVEQASGDDTEFLRSKGYDCDTRLFSRIGVVEGWELAVEHVLGEHMQALTCKENLDSKSHSDLMDRLVGSLSLVAETSETVMVNRGSLASVVTGATAFTSCLNKVRLAEDSAQALELQASLEGDESLVTPEGTWFGRHWVRYYNPAPEQTGMVARETKIRLLQQSYAESAERLEKVERQHSELSQQVKELDGFTDVLQKELKAHELERSKIMSSKSAHEARVEQQQIRLAKAQREHDSIEEALALDEELIFENDLSLDRVIQDQAARSEEREQLLLQRDSVRAEIEGFSRDLQRLQNDTHGLELRAQQQQSQKGLLEQVLRQLGDDQRRIREELEELVVLTFDESNIEDDVLRLEGLLDSRSALELKMGAARRELDEVAESIRKSEHFRMSCESDIQGLRDTLESLRMEKQALDLNQSACLEKIEQQGYELESVLPLIESEDSAAQYEALLVSLASKIQRLGAINLAAVEEYEDKAERKTYLDQQNDELNSALETLVDAIKKIDRETRARFKETYDQVNEGLQALFPKIFGGGSAHLELTEADLLETGVSIIARPPGKKNSTIHLLSGGEKALTAIALVFAIFELNPAPFCMLDEVDAPLDDANVGRFAAIVKEMSDRVQFIYISHNKVSMEKADQLMGVTMSEPGVSRLVSVDVDEAVALVEA